MDTSGYINGNSNFILYIMITVRNIQIYENVPFDQYLQMPGLSFSTIKNDGKEIKHTTKMELGSQVDNYLNTPTSFTGDLQIVKPIANALLNRVGGLYAKMQKQISITADFIYEGMCLKYKGRPDWGILKMLVIDLKVSENIEGSIIHFDYPNQLTGYALGLGAKEALIFGAHPMKHTVKSIRMDITKTAWWERTILKYGDPI